MIGEWLGVCACKTQILHHPQIRYRAILQGPRGGKKLMPHHTHANHRNQSLFREPVGESVGEFGAAEALIKNPCSSGNVLVLILLAILLFAALGYAVSNSIQNSGSGTVESEKSKVTSADLQQFPSIIAQAITRLTISRNLTLEDLSFAHDGSLAYGTFGTQPTREVFNPQGGAVPYQLPPAGLNDGSEWIFNGALELEDMGTTAGDATSSDLLALLPGVSLASCRMINSGGNINALTTPPSLTLAGETTPFTGSFTYADTISDAALNGRTAGCYFSTALNKYVYVHVLASR